MIVTAPAVPTDRLRDVLARSTEFIGAALIALVVWQALFADRPSFGLMLLGIGVLGIASALLTGRTLRTPLDAPLLAYVLITLVSAVVNHGRFSPAVARDEVGGQWQPALAVVAFTVYFYGGSWLLATPRRLAVLVTLLVVAISLFGVQAAYVHARDGFQYRVLDYPYLTRWTGYTPIGLLFALAFALVLPVVAVARSAVVASAAAVLTLIFFADSVGIYSRASTASAILAYGVTAVIEVVRMKRVRLAAGAAVAAMVFAIVALRAHPPGDVLAFIRGDFYSYRNDPTVAYTSRFNIWSRVVPLVRDHLWLGVGPGHYGNAMERRYGSVKATETYFENYTIHAHSVALQVAAESGVPAAVAFLLIWWRAFDALVRASRRDYIGVLALGWLAVLVAFLFKLMLEHLLSGLIVSMRVNVLLWTMFAAAVATVRVRAALVARESQTH